MVTKELDHSPTPWRQGTLQPCEILDKDGFPIARLYRDRKADNALVVEAPHMYEDLAHILRLADTGVLTTSDLDTIKEIADAALSRVALRRATLKKPEVRR